MRIACATWGGVGRGGRCERGGGGVRRDGKAGGEGNQSHAEHEGMKGAEPSAEKERT